jgi:hypothetical protein
LAQPLMRETIWLAIDNNEGVTPVLKNQA